MAAPLEEVPALEVDPLPDDDEAVDVVPEVEAVAAELDEVVVEEEEEEEAVDVMLVEVEVVVLVVELEDEDEATIGPASPIGIVFGSTATNRPKV